jgi:hypothetical protein
MVNKMFRWIRARGWLALNVTIVALLLANLSLQVVDRADGSKAIIRLGYIAEAAGTVDYTYNGTNDHIPWQAALDALPATGGRLVDVSGVEKNFAGTVARAIPNVVIEGAGFGSLFTNNNSAALFTAGTNWTFRDLATDAGGITLVTSTVLDNVLLGTNYYPNRYLVGTSGYATLNATQLTATTANITTLNAPTGRGATYVIAGANATALEKAQADAVATGLADDVLFQSYLDIAAPSHGSVKWFGTLNITSPILLRSSWYDFTIEGDGWNSVLQANNGLNDTIIKSDDTGARIWRITLKDFRIAGNQVNQSKGSGIYLWGASFSLLDHLYIANCKGDGITLNGSVSLQGTDIWIRNIRSESNNGTGINSLVYGGSDLTLTNSVLQSNNLVGFQSANGGMHISNNQIYSNGQWGIDASGLNNSFVGNEVVENGLPNVTGGVILRGACDYNSWTGGIIADNGNTYGGLYVAAGATYNTVTGVSFASSGSTTHGYAILEDAGANFNTYIGNSGTIGSIKGILSQGTGSLVRSNVSYVTENSGNFTITAGQWGVSVNHGLATNATAVQLTLTSNCTTAVYTSFGTFTSTQFTANLSALQGSDITGTWRAVIGAGN